MALASFMGVWSLPPVRAENLDEWPELDQSIKEAKKSVEDLNYYVDGAFKDGIVTETEPWRSRNT